MSPEAKMHIVPPAQGDLDTPEKNLFPSLYNDVKDAAAKTDAVRRSYLPFHRIARLEGIPSTLVRTPRRGMATFIGSEALISVMELNSHVADKANATSAILSGATAATVAIAYRPAEWVATRVEQRIGEWKVAHLKSTAPKAIARALPPYVDSPIVSDDEIRAWVGPSKRANDRWRKHIYRKTALKIQAVQEQEKREKGITKFDRRHDEKEIVHTLQQSVILKQDTKQQRGSMRKEIVFAIVNPVGAFLTFFPLTKYIADNYGPLVGMLPSGIDDALLFIATFATIEIAHGHRKLHQKRRYDSE